MVSEASDSYQPDSATDTKALVTALWDTGATSSVISSDLASRLSLPVSGRVMAAHAGGTSRVNVHEVNIYLPNGEKIEGLKVIEATARLQDFDVIIGMDIITRGDLALTNKDGKSCFSFRIPSQAKIDFTKV